MPFTFYKIVHLLGLILLFWSLGGSVIFHSFGIVDNKWKKIIAITHGVSLFLLFLAGFGMIAKLGIHWPWPIFIYLKMVIWFLLGVSLAITRKFAKKSKFLWFGIPLLGFLAILVVQIK